MTEKLTQKWMKMVDPMDENNDSRCVSKHVKIASF
jgi:hypothetical protein